MLVMLPSPSQMRLCTFISASPFSHVSQKLKELLIFKLIFSNTSVQGYRSEPRYLLLPRPSSPTIQGNRLCTLKLGANNG